MYKEYPGMTDQQIVKRWYVPTEYIVPLLSLVNTIWSVTASVGGFTYTVGSTIWKSLQPNLYIFYQGHDYPYKATDYKMTGPGVPSVEWFYDSSSKVFSTPSGSSSPRRFPWLSAEIKHVDLTLYDITDFVDSLRYYNTEEVAPSAERIIAVWSLESGIVLDKVGSLKLSVINEEGVDEEVSLYECGN
jgi:hypothetical protein